MALARVATKTSRRRLLRRSLDLALYGLIFQLLPLRRAWGASLKPMKLADFWEKVQKDGATEVGVTEFSRNAKPVKLGRFVSWKGTDSGAFLVNPFGGYTKIDLPTAVHSFNPHPVNKNWVWAVPGLGPKSVLFDIKTGQLIDEIEIPGLSFYGHGQILQENGGEVAFMTMYEGATPSKGMIVKYDLTKKKVIDILKTEQDSFHEIVYNPATRSFYVAGRNSKNAIFYEVSVQKPAVLQAFDCPERAEFRHLEMLKNGDIFLLGYGDADEKYPHNVASIARFDAKAKKIRVMPVAEKDAEEFIGEALNAVLDDSQTTAFVANPYNGSDYEVDLSKMTLTKTHKFMLLKSFRKLSGQYVSMAVAKDRAHSSYFVGENFWRLKSKEIHVDSRPSGFGSHMAKITV